LENRDTTRVAQSLMEFCCFMAPPDLVTSAFVDALYGAGEPLDLSHYFLVIPDVIGAGDSSKPSDGLRAHFPRYGYKDQVRAQHKCSSR
jgi:homoserine acetyltransferase